MKRFTYLAVLAALKTDETSARVGLDVAGIQCQSHRTVCLRQVEELQTDVGHSSVGPHHGAGRLVGQTLAVTGHGVLIVGDAEALVALRLLQAYSILNLSALI